LPFSRSLGTDPSCRSCLTPGDGRFNRPAAMLYRGRTLCYRSPLVAAGRAGGPPTVGDERMKVVFAKPDLRRAGATAGGVLEERRLPGSAAALDRDPEGAIGRALAASSRFKGRADDLLNLLAPAGLGASRVVLVGLGKPTAFDARAAQAVGGRIVAYLNGTGETEAAVAVDDIEGSALRA